MASDASTYEAKLKFINDYCDVCPVVWQCKDTASPDDLKFTVRGGLMPTEQAMRAKGRPNLPMDEDSIKDRWIERRGGTCIRGHDASDRDQLKVRMRMRVAGPSYDVYCRTCMKEDDREQYAAKVERAKLEAGLPGDADLCRNNHVRTPDNTSRKRDSRTGREYVRCLQCDREGAARRDAKIAA